MRSLFHLYLPGATDFRPPFNRCAIIVSTLLCIIVGCWLPDWLDFVYME